MTTRRAQPPSPARGATRRFIALVAAAGVLLLPLRGNAQSTTDISRAARFDWDATGTELSTTFSFRDVIDAAVQRKLSRGLPTTIVLTGTLYIEGSEKPVSATLQTCKITWHVWNEAYRVETTRPEGSRTGWTTTLEGVLRRCAEARGLLVATKDQVYRGARVFLKGKVQVNPISPELSGKIKRWVSRPVRTGTAAPGDALFSTFTGLFMQRIGDAERTLEFSTIPSLPAVPPKEENGK